MHARESLARARGTGATPLASRKISSSAAFRGTGSVPSAAKLLRFASASEEYPSTDRHLSESMRGASELRDRTDFLETAVDSGLARSWGMALWFVLLSCAVLRLDAQNYDKLPCIFRHYSARYGTCGNEGKRTIQYTIPNSSEICAVHAGDLDHPFAHAKVGCECTREDYLEQFTPCSGQPPRRSVRYIKNSDCSGGIEPPPEMANLPCGCKPEDVGATYTPCDAKFGPDFFFGCFCFCKHLQKFWRTSRSCTTGRPAARRPGPMPSSCPETPLDICMCAFI